MKSSLIEPQVLRDPSALSAADEHFLRTIGRQLWQNYLTAELPRRPNWKMWPGNRIDECSLGMRGFGMNVAFAHSAPKAMLPLFWGGGRVTFSDCEVDWMPLAPSAA